MSAASQENRAYLKRAWRHLLSKGLWRHKKRAAIIFFVGILATFVQIFAVILLIGAAKAYDSNGVLSFSDYSIDLSKNAPFNQLIYACVTGTMIVLSILASLGHKLIVTRIGRRFYPVSYTHLTLPTNREV